MVREYPLCWHPQGLYNVSVSWHPQGLSRGKSGAYYYPQTSVWHFCVDTTIGSLYSRHFPRFQEASRNIPGAAKKGLAGESSIFCNKYAKVAEK